MEGVNCGIIWGTILAFSCKVWEKQKNIEPDKYIWGFCTREGLDLFRLFYDVVFVRR
jgi:hypothetical protein